MRAKLRIILLTSIALLAFAPRAKSQIGVELAELMIGYFMSWEELSVQAEVRPSLNNTYFSYGFRGGHTNRQGNFTGGMAFLFSRDNNHGLIQSGRYSQYRIGLYLEKKFRPHPTQGVYFSVPVDIGLGEAIAGEVQVPQGGRFFAKRSPFWYFEPEVLLNCRLSKGIHYYVGVGYRHCSGSYTYGLTDELMSGFTAQTGLRFGYFD